MMIKVSQNMDANQIADLKAKLLLAFNSQGSAVLDVDSVENISTSLLQLFILAQKYAKDNGYLFSMNNTSEIFMSIIKDFGCEQHFEGAYQ
jgi:anti-anti-sigma regulatory factor